MDRYGDRYLVIQEPWNVDNMDYQIEPSTTRLIKSSVRSNKATKYESFVYGIEE